MWVVNKSNYQSERRLQAPQTRYNTFIEYFAHHKAEADRA
jgi:hypothetical protein